MNLPSEAIARINPVRNLVEVFGTPSVSLIIKTGSGSYAQSVEHFIAKIPPNWGVIRADRFPSKTESLSFLSLQETHSARPQALIALYALHHTQVEQTINNEVNQDPEERVRTRTRSLLPLIKAIDQREQILSREDRNILHKDAFISIKKERGIGPFILLLARAVAQIAARASPERYREVLPRIKEWQREIEPIVRQERQREAEMPDIERIKF